MATPTQYTLSLKEIAEAILVKEGIKEGLWFAGVNFGIQVGNMNIPPKNTARPSASLIVEGFNIARIPDGETPPKEMESLIVDASSL